MRRLRGFTLVELVLVIVLLGVTAGILAPFITGAMTAYRDNKERAELVTRGRLALERLAREVRHAVPNSLSVLKDAGGAPIGIEFLRAAASGRYVAEGDNYGAGFADPDCRLAAAKPLTDLYLLDPAGLVAVGNILIIGNTQPADLTGGGSTATITALPAECPGATVASVPAGGKVVSFAAAEPFAYAFEGRRYFTADRAIEVLLSATDLVWHEGAGGLADYDGASSIAAGDPLLVQGVNALNLVYDFGVDQSSAVLRIDLTLGEGGSSVQLYHEVHVRNPS